MTGWTVETIRPGGAPGTMAHQVRAAYMTTEPASLLPGGPSWMIFLDADHDIVAQFNAAFVVAVRRDTMAEAQANPGLMITR